MEKNKKTIADEALMDIEVIKAALTENAKEILRSVTREEIEDVIKESLNEEDFEEEEVDFETKLLLMPGFGKIPCKTSLSCARARAAVTNGAATLVPLRNPHPPEIIAP